MPRIPTYQANIPVKSGNVETGLRMTDATPIAEYALGHLAQAFDFAGDTAQAVADAVYKRELKSREEDKKVYALDDATKAEQEALEVGKQIDEAPDPDTKITIYNAWKKRLEEIMKPDRFSIDKIGDNTPLQQRIKQTGGFTENEVVEMQARLANTLGHYDARYAKLIVDAKQTRNVQIAQGKTTTSLLGLLDGVKTLDEVKADIVDAYGTTVQNPQVHIAEEIKRVTIDYLNDAFRKENNDVIEQFNKGFYNKDLMGAEDDKGAIEHFNVLNKELTRAEKIDKKQAELEAKNEMLELAYGQIENIESTWSDRFIQRKLKESDLIKERPMGFEKWPSSAKNRWNTAAEKFTGLLEQRRREDERKAKEGTKSADARLYNHILGRAITDWSDDRIAPESKLSDEEVRDYIRSGEITPKQGEKVLATLSKSRTKSDPILIINKKRALNDIKSVYKIMSKDSDETEKEQLVLDETELVGMMDMWFEKNPKGKYTDFTSEVLAPVSRTSVQKVVDFLFGDEELTPEEVKKRAITKIEKQQIDKGLLPITKTINGKTYQKIDGKWYEK